MRILLLDTWMAVEDAVYAEFSSASTVYDYDLVLWDPLRTIKTYNMPSGRFRDRTFRGRRWLSSHDSAEIARDVVRRRKEFAEFLGLGRTLVVFLPSDITVARETGETKVSGTGRNQKVTTILEDFDVLDALPVDLKREFATGTDMQPIDGAIGPLYRKTAPWWLYGCLLESDAQMHPLLHVAGTTKVVAAEIAYESGRIILLPLLCVHGDDAGFDSEDDIDDQDIITGSAEAARSRESGEVNEPVDPDEGTTAAAIDDLVLRWLITRASTDDIEWPKWVDDYRFRSEIDRAAVVQELEAKAAKIRTELDEFALEQESDRKWKLLIAGTGTSLEIVVADAFKVLGFELEPVAPGRTDLRGMRRGRRVVVETKGVAKTAAEKHCAQLEKWVAAELEEDERNAKGILVINAFLNDPPLLRRDPPFPSQMQPYAEKREHCLITGLQLLNIVRTALAKPERCDELADLLLETSGVLKGWNDLSEVFDDIPAG